jgi:hypothetical protein
MKPFQPSGNRLSLKYHSENKANRGLSQLITQTKRQNSFFLNKLRRKSILEEMQNNRPNTVPI